MSNPLVSRLPVLAILALTGCQTLATRTTSEERTAPIRSLPFEQTETPPGEMDADLVYNYLAGEIGIQRGDSIETYEHLMQAARRAKDPVAAAQAARMAIKLNDMQRAADAASLWIRLAPNSIPARQLATILALRKKDMAEALAQSRAVVRISQAIDRDGFLQLATVLASEKLDNKIELLRQLTRLYPQEPHAWYALALVATQRKQFDLAHEALDEALKLDPSWDKPWLLRAQLHNLRQNPSAAEKTLAEAARQHPSAAILQARGRLLMQQKRYHEALEAFRQAARLEPDNSNILATIGLLGIQTRKWEVARDAWLKIARNPNVHKQQEAWYFLGQLEELQEHPQAAIDYYRKVKGGRFQQEALLRRAILTGKQGHLDEAASLFREARLTNPRQAIQTFLAEAQLYKEEGKPDRAMATYDEAIAANPDNPDLLYARGLLAADLGRVEQAEKDLRAVLDLAPDDTDALNALGYTLADQTDRLEEAYAYIRRALKQEPDSAAILDSMGWVLYRMGRLEESLEFLRKAADRLQDGEISAHLGEVLWKTGRREEARKVWNEALRQAPENPKLKQTIQRFQ